MPSGGARARSGPAPDPNALRRNRKDDQAGWVTLPGPREGDAPEWPDELADPAVSELAMWAREWKRPQARMWEVNGQEFEVAAYVRAFLKSVRPDAPAAWLAPVIRMQENLGLSLSGLARNRWKIGVPVEAEDRQGRAVARAKDRGLTVVRGGNADAA